MRSSGVTWQTRVGLRGRKGEALISMAMASALYTHAVCPPLHGTMSMIHGKVGQDSSRNFTLHAAGMPHAAPESGDELLARSLARTPNQACLGGDAGLSRCLAACGERNNGNSSMATAGAP